MITIKRKLIDGRIISYTGERGEMMKLDGWHDEKGNVVPVGSLCRLFDDGTYEHVYDEKGERIPF